MVRRPPAAVAAQDSLDHMLGTAGGGAGGALARAGEAKVSEGGGQGRVKAAVGHAGAGAEGSAGAKVAPSFVGEGTQRQELAAQFEAHVAAKQEAAAAAVREEAERKREYDDAKWAAQERVDAEVARWAGPKHSRKNLRAMLASLDTVLTWQSAANRWQKVGLHQLVLAADVKKAHRKAILLVHPGKDRASSWVGVGVLLLPRVKTGVGVAVVVDVMQGGSKDDTHKRCVPACTGEAGGMREGGKWHAGGMGRSRLMVVVWLCGQTRCSARTCTCRSWRSTCMPCCMNRSRPSASKSRAERGAAKARMG